MANKQKLELTWIGKENRPKLEPRILREAPEKSYHASHHDLFDNQLIVWDNKSGSRGHATPIHTPWSELRTEWRKRNE
jgi:hypothetical protein